MSWPILISAVWTSPIYPLAPRCTAIRTSRCLSNDALISFHHFSHMVGPAISSIPVAAPEITASPRQHAHVNYNIKPVFTFYFGLSLYFISHYCPQDIRQRSSPRNQKMNRTINGDTLRVQHSPVHLTRMSENYGPWTLISSNHNKEEIQT